MQGAAGGNEQSQSGSRDTDTSGKKNELFEGEAVAKQGEQGPLQQPCALNTHPEWMPQQFPGAESSWSKPELVCYLLSVTSGEKKVSTNPDPPSLLTVCPEPQTCSSCRVSHEEQLHPNPEHLFPRDIQGQLFTPSTLTQGLTSTASPNFGGGQ